MNALRLAQRVRNKLEELGYRPSEPQKSTREPDAAFFYVFREKTRKTKATRIRSHSNVVGIVYVGGTGDLFVEAPEDEPSLRDELEAALKSLR